MVVAMPFAPVEIMGRRFTRAGLAVLPADGEFEQVADVTGDQVFEPAVPFPVRVAPADLVRWSPVA
jgi:hypothetical protein